MAQMDVTLGARARAIIAGGAAAAVLIAAYAFGAAQAGRTPAAYAQAATGPAGSAGAAAKITTTGTGTASGTPDQLVAQLGVQTHGISVTSTLGDANRAVDRIRNALRRYGVADKDLQTAGLSVQPSYAAGDGIPNGYEVSESLTARLHRLATAGDAISAAASAGGNATRINGVSLDMSSTSALLATARAAAVSDATTKARQYARAAGRTLGPVISIQEATMPPPLVFGSAAASARASVPISPGTQQLSVTVTVVFGLQ